MTKFRIKTRYYWRLFCIKIKLWQRLTRLWVAGKLVRFAFWMCSDLKRNMGYD